MGWVVDVKRAAHEAAFFMDSHQRDKAGRFQKPVVKSRMAFSNGFLYYSVRFTGM